RALRVDLTGKDFEIEELSEGFLKNYLGGRGLNMRRLYDEVPPEVDPLSIDNKLFIGVGPLNGTLFPGAARVNFSAKSPQTGILGDSNTGGFFGPELKFAGFDQVIIEGRAAELSYLYIKDGEAELKSATHLAGNDIYDTQSSIEKEIGDERVQVACVGPAAENGVRYSGIFCNRVRAAARTGMGLVMANKNLKAIAVRGTLDLRAKKPGRFKEIVDKLDRQIREHEEYEIRKRLGTTKLVSSLNEAGCLATRHFQTGRFEAVDQVSGEYLEEHYKQKSKACYSCTIPCSRFFEIDRGKRKGLKSEGPEFEGLAGFSSRVGVDSIEDALKGVDLCNRYGIDVITTSECISFVMELYQRGILKEEETDGLDLSWGNAEAVLTLVEKIVNREGLGDLLADGVVAAARRIGRGSLKYAMHVKGLEIFQADPRGIKGYALGKATATRGGDHLRSEPSFEFFEDADEGRRRFGVPESAFRLEYKGKGKVVKFHEERCVLADCMNVCKNTISNMEILSYDEAAELLRALTGIDFTGEGIRQSAERIMNLERAYIAREGIRREDDTLPERFLKTPLPEECGESAGSVVELEPMLDEYYREHGWNQQTGIPGEEKLRELGLEGVIEDFRKRGIDLG
ncbi:MAG: aldehyde ferredoxin oxidoreductase family protein, partial [Bacillota bacterium]